MSCPNFSTQDDYPLFLWDFEMSDEQLDECVKERAEIDEIDIENVDRDEEYQIQSEWAYQDQRECFKDTVNNVLKIYGRELQFLKLKLKDGYYGGLQFYVEPNTEYSSNKYFFDMYYMELDYITENVTNEDTRYCFDMCRSEFIRKYKSEVNFIAKKLMPKVASMTGFEQYSCMGIFSNGEAVYTKVA